jgi:hypothetical protein
VDAIGRDTFILRHLAGIARKQLKLNTDLPALVDEWAASLFKELDYRRYYRSWILQAFLITWNLQGCFQLSAAQLLILTETRSSRVCKVAQLSSATQLD